jgi:hypothetical protein
VDRFERVFVPVHSTCSVTVLDANGNIITRMGERGSIDNRGKRSLVTDPDTKLLRPRRPDDPPDIESPFAKPDITFLFPQYVGATDEAVYVFDRKMKALRRVKLGYHAEETVPVP